MLPFENLQFILRLVADKDQVACDKLYQHRETQKQSYASQDLGQRKTSEQK